MRDTGGPSPRDRGPRAPQGRPSVPVDSRRGHPGEQRRPSAPPPPGARDGRRTGASAPVRRVESASGPRVHGALAVLGVFLVTLVAAAIDSFLSSGLGLVTVVALTASTVVAALVTRRRDLLTVLVAPPLVYVAVAVVNVALAPAATLSLPSLATLLVRGFPAMGVATAAAVVVGLFRLVARR
ncbi:hypothetical protein G3R41_13000 [Modestobacter muralis]|nr:DUF6542 domain-containing protein [Modestobacter muralis]NEN51843.1 hypothetical protein [Modestobacter muralis]